MKLRLFMLTLAVIAAPVLAHEVVGEPVPPARNKDGSVVTGVLTPQFNPGEGIIPFPSNLLYLESEDLTLNPPVADPTDFSDPAVALSAVDGFSTTEKWVVNFVDDNGSPGAIDPASVIPGVSVRVFQVTAQGFVAVTGVLRELTPLQEFVAAASGSSLVIIPTAPLDEYSTFMAVLTNDIRDMAGNNATADRTYHLSKRDTPWIDENGKSTYPLIPDSSAGDLELLRQITATMEFAAEGEGINHDDIVLAWTVQTQSITRTLKEMRAIAQPAPVLAAPTPFDTSAIGGFGLADIVIGVITVPYYGGVPAQANDPTPLFATHQAAPGAYVPPFDQFPLDPTSTNITIANPFPVPTGMQTVPILATVPSAASGFTKPASGWPVVMFIPSLTRNRTDMLALADAMAGAGYAMIAMDLPLHGVVPAVEPHLAPFYIENTPFAPIANERTFDADLFNNETNALGPDGITDASGSSYFNLLNLRALRDNQRQGQIDLSVLATSLQNISLDGDATPDLDVSNVGLATSSLGVFVGTAVAAVEPLISRAYLNTGGAHAMRTVIAGSYGDRINAALAGAGVFPGTADYEQFVIVAQTMLDPTDPANWAGDVALKMPVIHNQVANDDTVPNRVLGAPMGGNEGLNSLMGLQSYAETTSDLDGLLGVARFNKGEHGSLFRPTFPDVTIEMQGQMVSFLVSGGTFVNVANPAILEPVVALQRGLQEPSAGDGKKRKKRKGDQASTHGEPGARDGARRSNK